MGFGVSGFINAFTQKAIIRYLDPDFADTVKERTGPYLTLDDFTIEGDGTPLGNLKSMAKQSIAGYLASFVGIIKEVNPDVKKAEAHKYQSDITEYALEDGSILVQHIIQKPIEVSLQFEETNSGKMISGIVGFAAETFLGKDKTTLFEKLVQIWQRKIPVEIITEHQIYKNMVVKNMPIIHKSPYKKALQIIVDFIQLTSAQTQLNGYKASTTDVAKAASPKIDGGQQLTQSVSLEQLGQ